MCLAWELPEPLFEYIAGSLVVTFRKSKLTEEYLNTLILNTRQKKAIEYLKKNKEISNKVYREINNVGKVIAAEELNNLVKKEIFKITGKGRATKYVLND
jgi:ATP-dependent DNA helicase RecG